ncbi:MAG: hypothetical protein P1U56_14955 [Saprospiraceae bacterium]|nr:hypothetical protein [Saprospiraceae bacterium]
MRFKELYKKSRDIESKVLDEESMWNVIEQNLDKPKKKRRAIWWWFFGGIALLGLLLMMHQSSSSDHIISDKPLYKENEILANSIPEPIISYFDQDEEKEYSNNKMSVPENTDIPSSSTHVFNSTSEELNLQNYNLDTSLESNQKLGINRIEDPNTSMLKASLIGTRSENFDQVKKGESENDRVIFEAKGFNLSETKLLIPQVDRLPMRSSLSFSSEELELSEFVQVKNLQSFRYEFVFNLSYLTHRNSILADLPDTQLWANLHDLSNSPSPSFEISTLLRTRLGNGLGVGLGLKVRQISEWYNASITDVEPVQIQSDSSAYVTINGIREYASGFLTGISTQTTHYRTPIRRFYIDLPIAMNYRKSIGFVDFNLDLAYNFNISHRYYGRSYNEDLVLLNQKKISESELFRSRFVHSANIGLGINYHCSDLISIGIKANYWKQLSSSLTSTILEEKYTGVGIGLCLEKRM